MRRLPPLNALQVSETVADWQLWLDYAQASGRHAEHGQSFGTSDPAINAALRGFGATVSDCSLVCEEVTEI